MGAVAACLILLMVFVWLWHRNIQVLANHVKQLSLAALARSNLNAHAKNFVLLLVDFFQPKPVAGVQFILLTCVSLTLVGHGLLVNLHMGLWVAAFAVVFLFWQLFWQRGIKPWLANRIETLQTFHERSQDKVLEGVEGHWGQTYGLTQQSNYPIFWLMLNKHLKNLWFGGLLSVVFFILSIYLYKGSYVYVNKL
ncbi:MAG: hypothetical protein HC831_27005, partial [Chloroflexia bacterium]|nr:hypothetical protein [Chloroflexia bacterium]